MYGTDRRSATENMGRLGFEPRRDCSRQILSLLRMPVSPPVRDALIIVLAGARFVKKKRIPFARTSRRVYNRSNLIEWIPMPKFSAKSQFPALTGVRAIAAYLVFFHHGLPANLPGFIYSLATEFHTGVTIFFVLSGFLIYLKYSGSSALKKDFLLEYYRNRVARIYPVYFLGVIVTALLAYRTIPWSLTWQQIVLQLTFVRGFSEQFKFIGIAQGWTLTVEECFYLLFPLLILLQKKMRSFFAPLFCIYAVGFAALMIGNHAQYLGYFTPARFVILYTFFGRAAEFFAGMYLAKFILTRQPAAAARRIPVATVIGLIGFAAFVYWMSKLKGHTLQYGLYHPFGMVINNLILPVFVAMLFFGLITERSPLRALLGSKPMVLLGKSSYVFYLIHVGFIQSFLVNKISADRWIQFALLIGIAILIYFCIEEPSRRLIRRIPLTTTRTSQRAEPASGDASASTRQPSTSS
jgi:peptidoglycan/LPS O-acetylase OafA/YrhL